MRQRIITFLENLRDRWADRHSRIKVAKIRRVFAREGGLIGGSLSSTRQKICDHPGRCATGALLFAAGVIDSELAEYGMPVSDHLDILRDVYGLLHNESISLVTANDGYTWKEVWRRCGVAERPEVNVRVCVVNERLDRIVAA